MLLCSYAECFFAGGSEAPAPSDDRHTVRAASRVMNMCIYMCCAAACSQTQLVHSRPRLVTVCEGMLKFCWHLRSRRRRHICALRVMWDCTFEMFQGRISVLFTGIEIAVYHTIQGRCARPVKYVFEPVFRYINRLVLQICSAIY
jgi:hypothetical protein